VASKFIRDVELSRVLGIPLPTIRADRLNERRLPYIKLGRSVLYDPDECVHVLQKFKVGGGQQDVIPRLPSGITKLGR
jgi:hypothetical protein